MQDIENEIKTQRNAENAELFADFKAVCPNSLEVFNSETVTESDIQRWLYHINQARLNADVSSFLFEIDPAHKALKASRMFYSWAYMHPYMKANYLQIVDCFIGYDVYAVGSRVNGDYVERFSNNKIREMRKGLGKTEKIESDYDYVILGYDGGPLNEDQREFVNGIKNVNECLELNALRFPVDHVKHLPPGEHKIKIPMWDFSKLPTDKKQEAKEMFAAQQWGKLMQLHNDYELSQNHYCCDETPIIRWFKWAIDNGKLD